MNIKHSKLRNTGILFELLTRQIVFDTISGQNSKAIDIVKKYFVNSELSKEHKLYQFIINSNILSESKAETLIETILAGYRKLNKSQLKKEKYNIIKEIKQNYNINEFFKYKIKNYKELASIYTLFESYNTSEFIEPSQIVDNRCNLLEYITKQEINKNKVEDDVLSEYLKLDKGTRLIAYKSLIEKFNRKYSNLMFEQKQILAEYINNIDNILKLKECFNQHNIKLRKQLNELSRRIDDATIKIKLTETINLLQPLDKNQNVKDENIISLLQYYELLDELKHLK